MRLLVIDHCGIHQTVYKRIHNRNKKCSLRIVPHIPERIYIVIEYFYPRSYCAFYTVTRLICHFHSLHNSFQRFIKFYDNYASV